MVYRAERCARGKGYEFFYKVNFTKGKRPCYLLVKRYPVYSNYFLNPGPVQQACCCLDLLIPISEFSKTDQIISVLNYKA
jgi:hypothetical protein